jgi:hypothetical protein
LSANPLSTAAREAPIAAPRASANGGMRRSNSSFDFRPRPPETTFSAEASSGLSDLARSSETHSVGQGALGSTPSSTEAELEPDSAGGKDVCRTVRSLMGSVDWTVRMALPA